jgi:hypothetical protein
MILNMRLVMGAWRTILAAMVKEQHVAIDSNIEGFQNVRKSRTIYLLHQYITR